MGTAFRCKPVTSICREIFYREKNLVIQDEKYVSELPTSLQNKQVYEPWMIE